MPTLPIQRYYPRLPALRKRIKYFWVCEPQKAVTVHHKLLPVNTVDIVFNFKAPLTLEGDGGVCVSPAASYCAGIMDTPTWMHQQGAISTLGVTFFPAGLYPFVKMPLCEFRNRIVNLEDLFNSSLTELGAKLADTQDIIKRVDLIEAFFLAHLDDAVQAPAGTRRLLDHYAAAPMRIKSYCQTMGIHPKTFARQFMKYMGTTPKMYARIHRFGRAINTLLAGDTADLTTLAHHHHYYDQPHFIRDFKALSGSAPAQFLKEKKTIKQLLQHPPV